MWGWCALDRLRSSPLHPRASQGRVAQRLTHQGRVAQRVPIKGAWLNACPSRTGGSNAYPSRAGGSRVPIKGAWLNAYTGCMSLICPSVTEPTGPREQNPCTGS